MSDYSVHRSRNYLRRESEIEWIVAFFSRKSNRISSINRPSLLSHLIFYQHSKTRWLAWLFASNNSSGSSSSSRSSSSRSGSRDHFASIWKPKILYTTLDTRWDEMRWDEMRWDEMIEIDIRIFAYRIECDWVLEVGILRRLCNQMNVCFILIDTLHPI